MTNPALQIALPVAGLKPALIGLGKITPKRVTLPVLGSMKIERTRDGWVALTTTDPDRCVTARLEDTPSLPDADPRSIRPRGDGREGNFLAVMFRNLTLVSGVHKASELRGGGNLGFPKPRSRGGRWLAAMVFCTAVVATAHAQIITPLNGSFEGPLFAPNGNGADLTTPTNWTAIEDDGYITRQGGNSTAYNFSPDMDGACIYSMESNNIPNISLFGQGVIQQTLGTMVSGETYTFNATLFGNQIPDLNIFWGLTKYVSSFRISFLDVDMNMELAAITQADFNPGTGLNIPATFSYQVGASHAGNAMALRLAAVQPTIPEGYGAAFGRTGIDKVTVTTVPEPGAAVSLLGGLGLLLGVRRRRRA